MTRSPSTMGPVCTTFGTTVPSASTVITTLRDWSVVTAASGISSARMRRRRRAGASRAELAGRDELARVGEGGADADGAGGAVDLVVDEVDAAAARPVRLVVQPELRRRAGLARRAEPALGDGALIDEEVGSRSCRS